MMPDVRTVLLEHPPNRARELALKVYAAQHSGALSQADRERQCLIADLHFYRNRRISYVSPLFVKVAFFDTVAL